MTQSLSGIFVYPVKSLAGFSPTSWPLTEQGLKDDRRWMLVDEVGHFLSQRQLPALCFLEAQSRANGLWLHDRRGAIPDLHLSSNQARTGNPLTVQVWEDRVEGLQIECASAWFRQILDREVRLVYMPDTTRRQVDTTYARPGELVSFADGFPVLIAQTASLMDLNSRLEEPVGMDRFRPNLVLEGGTPWSEDQWQRVYIGAARFSTPKPCARCQMITIDPSTGAVGKEPMHMLSGFRKVGHKVLFGMNAIWDTTSEGIISVGDAVQVVNRLDENV